MFRLKEALESRGRNIWIDSDDIPPGAPWRRELGTGIEAADAFVFVISPDSVASTECGVELARATELGKRLVPVLHRLAEGVPAAVAAVQYIDAREDLDRVVEQVDHAIRTDHDWVRAHTQWLARALRWDEGAHDRSLLLRGSELEAAEGWLAQQSAGKEPPPTGLQTEYIVAGRHAERRRLRTIVGWTLAALAVSIVLAVLALVSRSEAIKQRDQARSRALANAALTQLDVDPERSLLLALEAERVAPSDAAHDALRRSLVESRVRAVMHGPTAAISRLAVSPDGRFVVTGGRDDTPREFDATSGKQIAALTGHAGPAEAVAISRDSRRILTASDDGTARLWDAADGHALHTLRPGGGAVMSAAFSPDGALVVTAGADGTVRLWRTDSGAPAGVLRGHRGEVRTAVFDRTGARVLSGGTDGTARLWDVASRQGRVLARFPSTVNTAEFRGRRQVMLVDDVGTVSVQNAASGHTVTELPGKAFDVALSPDGNAIATTTINGTAQVWNAATGARVAELEGHGGPVLDVQFSPDGRQVATAGLDSTARLWDAATGTAIAVLRGHEGNVNRVAFTPDGRSIVTAGNDRTARRWTAGTGTVLRLPSIGGPAVNAVVGGPDGHTVLTAGEDGLARLWDGRTGQQIDDHAQCGLPAAAPLSCLSWGVVNHQRTFMASADLSPDGRLVATGGIDGTAFVYDAHTGRVVAQLKGQSGRVEGVAFSPDGRRVATATRDGTARVWDVADGHAIAVMRGHASVDGPTGPDSSVNAVAFLPDGRRIATGGADGTVRLWDAANGHVLRVFRLTSGAVDEVAASPDGRYLAATLGETARVWDAGTGRTVANLTDHDGLVFSVGFSPDSRALVTGGQDLTARIWEIPSGRPLGVLRGHTAYLVTSRFSADGLTILTGAVDGTARVFPCDACGSPEQLVARARTRVTRALTAEERRRFLSG